ncbi:apolipoprotein N-acyltransferase [Aquamicrobium sp. LC103]|uniref:apolipoprotein N-acyltransferase n=1 Tax=Aquamicrobium sp. LC103 TaxID=1120658 RepID=UPI00063EBA2B|nr:apolipoprotein N-acyltransferase [Aquamicrobium sp. LC103]TKT69133.1 apolipoprotein N-acyltransferase [Aquamicrobium sp. LC103]
MERLAGRVILLSGWRRALVGFLAGALAAFSQPPYDFFAVCFVSFPVLVWLLDGSAGEPGQGAIRRSLPAFMIGWWFGFGYFAAGLWWTGNALLVEAELFAWALPLAIFGLPALLALFYGAATLLARALWSDDICRIAALAFAFGLAEWVRATVLTGFPWNAIGYAAMPVPVLMQSVRVAGLFGMSALAVFVFAMPALLASRRHRRLGLGLALLLAAAHAGYGFWRMGTAEAATGTLDVRIVQPSISQSEKWDASIRDRIFRTYLDLSARPPEAGMPRPELILWPETSVPFLLTQRPGALPALGDLVGEGQVLLAGAIRVEGPESTARYYNSVVAIDAAGEIYDATDKVHLVPFGEYLPFQALFERIGLRQLAQSVSAFSSGSQRHAITMPGGTAGLPFICYEIIFPGVAGFGDADADFLINVTNDAWFGDTPGPYQHFRQAQVRAVEAGRPLVRAANNGISGVVDAYGRVVDAFAINAVGVLDAALPIQRVEGRVLAGPSANGAAVLAVLALAALAARLLAGSRGRKSHKRM